MSAPELQNSHNISVTWRGKKFVLEMNPGACLKDLGQELLKWTDVRADTMRLIVPSSKSSKLLSPFSDEHSWLSLQETILEGKSIRMMGVPKDEVDEILKSTKTDLRIAGFDEEEKRLNRRMLNGLHPSLKLPQGAYIFCDFRTLHLPGVELNPPASEALKLMHMLAADPGIVAIMNKHHWRVGIMTEMAPVGYVGVSPKCILGFNENHGEEISLRLRTDDLKGFRKYESIKKTLLHELAHMVYSEHDAHFYALDKQLNQEVASLDWTKSRSHTLSRVGHQQYNEENFYADVHSNLPQKLGGETRNQLANARASSVAAAYLRSVGSSTDPVRETEADQEPDSAGAKAGTVQEADCTHAAREQEKNILDSEQAQEEPNKEPDPDAYHGGQYNFEPGPDDSVGGEPMEFEPYSESGESKTLGEPDPDDHEMALLGSPIAIVKKLESSQACKEADPDNLKAPLKSEPDPDDSEAQPNNMAYESLKRSDLRAETMINRRKMNKSCKEPDPDDCQANVDVQTEPDPDDNMGTQQRVLRTPTDESDPDDEEIQRIQDPVSVICGRLQKAIEMLRSEVSPSKSTTVLKTLFKIIQNVIEHPNETKFKKLRKANPVIQRNVVNYKAAMEILTLIGFNEDVVLDEIGKVETYLVLKRNDPGLLWLAKSSLEACLAY